MPIQCFCKQSCVTFYHSRCKRCPKAEWVNESITYQKITHSLQHCFPRHWWKTECLSKLNVWSFSQCLLLQDRFVYPQLWICLEAKSDFLDHKIRRGGYDGVRPDGRGGGSSKYRTVVHSRPACEELSHHRSSLDLTTQLWQFAADYHLVEQLGHFEVSRVIEWAW